MIGYAISTEQSVLHNNALLEEFLVDLGEVLLGADLRIVEGQSLVPLVLDVAVGHAHQVQDFAVEGLLYSGAVLPLLAAQRVLNVELVHYFDEFVCLLFKSSLIILLKLGLLNLKLNVLLIKILLLVDNARQVYFTVVVDVCGLRVQVLIDLPYILL